MCHMSPVMFHNSPVTFHMCFLKYFCEKKKWKKIQKHFSNTKFPRLVLIQGNEEFKKVCQLCNEDIIMKSWVKGMNQTREKLRSLNLHLTKKHDVARKNRVMLLVGDLSLKEQEFLELPLERYFVNIGGYPFLQMYGVLFVARSFI